MLVVLCVKYTDSLGNKEEKYFGPVEQGSALAFADKVQSEGYIPEGDEFAGVNFGEAVFEVSALEELPELSHPDDRLVPNKVAIEALTDEGGYTNTPLMSLLVQRIASRYEKNTLRTMKNVYRRIMDEGVSVEFSGGDIWGFESLSEAFEDAVVLAVNSAFVAEEKGR